MGAEINSTAMQEVGIMRLFHWLKFNWEAAVGWRRQERLLKSSSVPPFFIRELLSFLRPLPVPCPLATSLPTPYWQRCACSEISAVYILSFISGSGMINQPTNHNLIQLTLLSDSSTLATLTQTDISSHTPSSPRGEPPLKLHLSRTPPIYRCLFLSPHSSLSPPCSSPSLPCCTRATLCHFNMKTSVWLRILWWVFLVD